MARRSLLTPAREERPATPEPIAVPADEPARARAGGSAKPSRQAKLHIGGYYDPNNPTIIAFQKLGIDLRTPQQAMLLEAISDFVAKHLAARAFR
jgi:hypothetical protein